MRRLATAVLALGLLGACTDDEPDAEPSPTTGTSTADGSTSSTEAPPEANLDAVELALQDVVELDQPIAMAARPGSKDLYIAEKGGRVRLVEVDDDRDGDGDEDPEPTYELQSTPLVDLSERVINEGERGLLGMTFSSDGRKLYLDYTRRPDGHTVVVEYTLGDRKTVDRDSDREILVVEQPFANHNGGGLEIGPDGFLYVSLGDGGDGGDPFGNGQDPTTLLGSILRIDPERAGDGGPAYAIPPGNPFADGEDGAPEVWLYGVRNPWRFSFDPGTGDLWVADVGENAYEELTWLPATRGFDAGKGANLGWDRMEGSHPFDGGRNPEGGVLPIFEYGRDDGCSVIGGHVYRGEDIPGLAGTYLYSDYCGSGVRGLQVDGGHVIDERTWDLPIQRQYSFGRDDEGELYVLLEGGRVQKLVAPNAGG
jgi:glucose/arabinose dehydrogenase